VKIVISDSVEHSSCFPNQRHFRCYQELNSDWNLQQFLLCFEGLTIYNYAYDFLRVWYPSLIERRECLPLTRFNSTLSVSIVSHGPHLSSLQGNHMINSCSYLCTSSQRINFSAFSQLNTLNSAFLNIFDDRILINFVICVEGPNVASCELNLFDIFCELLNLLSFVIILLIGWI